MGLAACIAPLAVQFTRKISVRLPPFSIFRGSGKDTGKTYITHKKLGRFWHRKEAKIARFLA